MPGVLEAVVREDVAHRVDVVALLGQLLVGRLAVVPGGLDDGVREDLAHRVDIVVAPVHVGPLLSDSVSLLLL